MIRLRIIADQTGWAYEHRAKALMAHAPADFDVSLGYETQPAMGIDGQYDLVFLLNYGQPQAAREIIQGTPAKLVTSFNTGWPRRPEYLERCLEYADLTIINNQEYWEKAGKPAKTVWISNGVDASLYRIITPPSERPRRVLWCGCTYHRELKGYDDYLMPLRSLLARDGIDMELMLVDAKALGALKSQQQMAEWYNSGRVYVCASEVEGTPNTALEAACCGCAVVSTPVGNMPELITDGEGVLVERTVASLYDGVRCALDHYDMIWPKLRAKIDAEWDWPRRAPQFFDAFRSLM